MAIGVDEPTGAAPDEVVATLARLKGAAAKLSMILWWISSTDKPRAARCGESSSRDMLRVNQASFLGFSSTLLGVMDPEPSSSKLLGLLACMAYVYWENGLSLRISTSARASPRTRVAVFAETPVLSRLCVGGYGVSILRAFVGLGLGSSLICLGDPEGTSRQYKG